MTARYTTVAMVITAVTLAGCGGSGKQTQSGSAIDPGVSSCFETFNSLGDNVKNTQLGPSLLFGWRGGGYSSRDAFLSTLRVSLRPRKDAPAQCLLTVTSPPPRVLADAYARIQQAAPMRADQYLFYSGDSSNLTLAAKGIDSRNLSSEVNTPNAQFLISGDGVSTQIQLKALE